MCVAVASPIAAWCFERWLASVGLSPVDFWGSGVIRPLSLVAQPLRPAVTAFANCTFFGSVAVVLYLVALLAYAWVRRDGLAALVAGLSLGLAICGGLYSVGLIMCLGGA